MNDFSRKQLLVNYLLDICTDREKEEIERWLDKEPDNVSLLQEVANELGIKKEFSLPDKARIKEEVMRRVGKPTPSDEKFRTAQRRSIHRSRTGWFFRIAAVFIIAGFATLFGIFWFGDFQENGNEPTVMKEVITERGERAQFLLVDGTRVRLNADSKITYPEDFEQDTRAVHLSGEAFFEVTSDDRPFYVHTDETVVQVLGTEFNVKAYQEEEEIRVVVAGGKVAVRRQDAPEDEALLEKGEMASLRQNGNGVLSVTRNVDLKRHLGWLEYRLEFDSTSLAQVSVILERWYGIDITFADPGLTELRYSAVFEDESIDEILQAMKLSVGLEYEMQGREVTFYPEGTKGAH